MCFFLPTPVMAISHGGEKTDESRGAAARELRRICNILTDGGDMITDAERRTNGGASSWPLGFVAPLYQLWPYSFSSQVCIPRIIPNQYGPFSSRILVCASRNIYPPWFSILGGNCTRRIEEVYFNHISNRSCDVQNSGILDVTCLLRYIGKSGIKLRTTCR